MNSQANPLPAAAPDRQFARVTAILLCVALGFVVLSHVFMERTLRQEWQSAEIALASSAESAAARTIIATADRLAILTDPDEIQRTRSRLAWDTEQFASAEEHRARLEAEIGGGHQLLVNEIAYIVRTGLEIARDGESVGTRAEALSARIESDVLPVST